MSHQEVAGGYGERNPENGEVYDTHDTGHHDETHEHDQISTAQTEPAPQTSSICPVDELHLDTPHASTFAASYQTSTPWVDFNDGGALSSISPTSAPTEWTRSATDATSDFDKNTTVPSSVSSFTKPQVPELILFSNVFDPSLRGAPHESPISPLTIRGPFLHDLSQSSSTVDIAPTPPSQENGDADFEGISLQKGPFPRPPSNRSSTASTASSGRAPGLLTPKLSTQVIPCTLFLDPLGPQSEDQPYLGLPSLRHILDEADAPPDDDKIEPPPDLFKDRAMLTHLETLQREATDSWAQAAGTASGHERKELVDRTVGKLWHTSVSFLASLLRSHKTLRRLANLHRLSLGEIDKLRRHSKDAEGQVVEREKTLGLDIGGLRAENKLLRQQLALRDVGTALPYHASSSEEGEPVVMGPWLHNKEPFIGDSSSQDAEPESPVTVAGDIQPVTEPVPSRPETEVPDRPAVRRPIIGRPSSREDDVPPPRDAWHPDPAVVAELERQFGQLREDLAEERFEKEALREQLHNLEQQVVAFGPVGVAVEDREEPSRLEDAREAAARRMAELVGVRAALKTAQLSYEKGLGNNASLRRTCDTLEEQIAEKDYLVGKLEGRLRDVEGELATERRELTEARFEAEEREEVIANLRGQVEGKTKEVSMIAGELKILIGELSVARADIAELKEAKRKLAEDLYDQQTENGMMVQDLDCERTTRAREKAEFEKTKDELEERVATWDKFCTGLEAQIEELKEAVAQREATEARLQEDYGLLKDEVFINELKLSDAKMELQTLTAKVRRLTQENQSAGEVNKRLAEYLKSLRQEEGWKRLEELRERCKRLREQRAAWAPTIAEMAVKRGHAEQRYRLDHRALMKVREELAILRQQRLFDVERERQLMATISVLERAYEDARLALQDAKLRLFGARQIQLTHEQEIDDLEGILRSIGGKGTGKSLDPYAMHDVNQLAATEDPTPINLAHTSLPAPHVVQRKIFTKTVEHHHGQACFCSLVDYWFPGVLDKVLPRRHNTEDSGYDSDSDGHDSHPAIRPILESSQVPDDVSSQNSTPTADRDATASPHWEGYIAHLHDRDDEFNLRRDISLRGGAGSPLFSDSEAGTDDEETMGSPASLDDREDRSPTPEEEGEDDHDDSSQSSGNDAFAPRPARSPLVIPKVVRWGRPPAGSEVLSGTAEALSAVTAGDASSAVHEDIDSEDSDVKSILSGPSAAFSDAGVPQVENGRTQQTEQDVPSVVKGKHTTSAGETIDVKKDSGGGLKFTIRSPTSTTSETGHSSARTEEIQSNERDSEEEPEEEDLEEEEPEAGESEEDEPEMEQAVARRTAAWRTAAWKVTEGLSEDERSDKELSEGEPAEQELSGGESGAPTKEDESEEAGSEEVESQELDSGEARTDDGQSEEAWPAEAAPQEEQDEAQQEETQPEEAPETSQPQTSPLRPRAANPQPQQASQSPRRRPGPNPTASPIPDSAASLLSLIDTTLSTPSLDSPSTSLTFQPHQPHTSYHGHTSDGPFTGPGHFICQLLTALTWLALLIISQPSNLLSTLSIFLGYLLLPLTYLLRLALYYAILPLYLAKNLLSSLIFHYPTRTYPIRPSKPALGRLSAAAIVSSAVSLAIVFLIVALDTVRYERELWVRPNAGFTAAYVRDIVERRPYPWWSPVDVDLRLAVVEWARRKGNAVAFGERYVRSW